MIGHFAPPADSAFDVIVLTGCPLLSSHCPSMTTWGNARTSIGETVSPSLIVSDGSEYPYRVRIRTGSYTAMSIIDKQRIAAFRKLEQLRPSLLWWESGAQALQLLASGAAINRDHDMIQFYLDIFCGRDLVFQILRHRRRQSLAPYKHRDLARKFGEIHGGLPR